MGYRVTPGCTNLQPPFTDSRSRSFIGFSINHRPFYHRRAVYTRKITLGRLRHRREERFSLILLRPVLEKPIGGRDRTFATSNVDRWKVLSFRFLFVPRQFYFPVVIYLLGTISC